MLRVRSAAGKVVISNMKNHLAEFEKMKARIAVDDKIQGFLWHIRRTVPFPLNLAVLMAYHVGVEAQVCWNDWRERR